MCVAGCRERVKKGKSEVLASRLRRWLVNVPHAPLEKRKTNKTVRPLHNTPPLYVSSLITPLVSTLYSTIMPLTTTSTPRVRARAAAPTALFTRKAKPAPAPVEKKCVSSVRRRGRGEVCMSNAGDWGSSGRAKCRQRRGASETRRRCPNPCQHVFLSFPTQPPQIRHQKADLPGSPRLCRDAVRVGRHFDRESARHEEG